MANQRKTDRCPDTEALTGSNEFAHLSSFQHQNVCRKCVITVKEKGGWRWRRVGVTLPGTNSTSSCPPWCGLRTKKKKKKWSSYVSGPAEVSKIELPLRKNSYPFLICLFVEKNIRHVCFITIIPLMQHIDKRYFQQPSYISSRNNHQLNVTISVAAYLLRLITIFSLNIHLLKSASRSHCCHRWHHLHKVTI